MKLRIFWFIWDQIVLCPRSNLYLVNFGVLTQEHIIKMIVQSLNSVFPGLGILFLVVMPEHQNHTRVKRRVRFFVWNVCEKNSHAAFDSRVKNSYENVLKTRRLTRGVRVNS